MRGGQIQVQTSFGPPEINFLISVILGMALLVTRCVCMYVCGVDGFRGYGRLLNFISAFRCVWGSEGLGDLGLIFESFNRQLIRCGLGEWHFGLQKSHNK